MMWLVLDRLIQSARIIHDFAQNLRRRRGVIRRRWALRDLTTFWVLVLGVRAYNSNIFDEGQLPKTATMSNQRAMTSTVLVGASAGSGALKESATTTTRILSEGSARFIVH